MMSSKCKNCKDYVAQFYNCDICSYTNKERSTCNSKNLNEPYCVINVSSKLKSIPSVEGSGLTSPAPSALF